LSEIQGFGTDRLKRDVLGCFQKTASDGADVSLGALKSRDLTLRDLTKRHQIKQHDYTTGTVSRVALDEELLRSINHSNLQQSSTIGLSTVLNNFIKII